MRKARSPIESSDFFEATQLALDTISWLMNAAFGALNLSSTVSAPFAVTDSSVGQFGRHVHVDLRTRLMCHATVSASNGEPSLNVTPGRSLISNVMPSFDIV